MPRLHLIYVPGLGDHRVTGQQKLVATWRLWGVSAELFQAGWGDGEQWGPKFERLLDRIDVAVAGGQRVGLVGASAGATAVINAYHARQKQVVGVVLIAGMINRPTAISSSVARRNNAFGAAAHEAFIALSELSDLERSHVLSLYGAEDAIVPAQFSIVPGARNQKVRTTNHAVTIGAQLLYGAPSFIRFLRRQTSQ